MRIQSRPESVKPDGRAADSYDGRPQKVTNRADKPKTYHSYQSYKNMLISSRFLPTIQDAIMDICL
ncbi:MAG: hypothetical protein A2V45_02620 [Candidatus Aminicenantes bacterium RBG_19FT_COMBO_58_17]|nr:MAG: hypothetical protein A2V45_02620 [Candidatus Aminicenantes bacterium RBG_19FT_COMBO_58_17]